MQVVGLMGPIGSGKGAVADLITKDFSYGRVTMGDLVREEAEKQGLEPTRDNLVTVSEDLREKHGQDFFIKKAIRKIDDEGWDKIVIDGVRLPLEVAKFSKAFGDAIKFVLVTAKPETRFERMKTRARPGFPKTLEEFKKHEEREWAMFNFKKTFGSADFTVNNDGSWEELQEQVENIMESVWS